MSDTTTDTTVDEDVPIDKQGPFGEGVVRVEIDEDTHRRLRDAYEVGVEQGYSDAFDMFAINHLSNDYEITVDGETIYPRDAE
mgnify:CR=1 FL=1